MDAMQHADDAQLNAEPQANVEPQVDDVELDVLVLEDAPTLALPVWEPTGDAEVDAALEQLRRLDDAELSEHVEVFAEVHSALHARLSGISGQPGA